MKTRKIVFPGSFDPITVGHLDLIERASKLFDEVVVTVFHNVAKHDFLSVPQRIALIEKATAHLPNVTADAFSGLQVEYMREKKINVVLRGVRSARNFEAESVLADANRSLMPGLETIVLITKPEHSYVSSSMVRELMHFGASAENLMPPGLWDEMQRMLHDQEKGDR